MCGVGAMGARCVSQTLEGCDETESELCSDFANTLVRCSAGVIYGIKPVALFSYRPRIRCASQSGTRLREKLRELVRTYRRELVTYGIRLEPLSECCGRVMLLAYREELVEKILQDGDDRLFLEHAGYATQSARSLMSSMRRRLVEYYQADGARRTFPHEMGLLFGYPLADVVGFINGAQPTCRGAWMAYGDAEESRRRFELVSRVEGECRGRFRAGETLRGLLESA